MVSSHMCLGMLVQSGHVQLKRSAASHSRCVHISSCLTSAVTLQFETTDMHILAQAFAVAYNMLNINCVDVMCT